MTADIRPTDIDGERHVLEPWSGEPGAGSPLSSAAVIVTDPGVPVVLTIRSRLRWFVLLPGLSR